MFCVEHLDLTNIQGIDGLRVREGVGNVASAAAASKLGFARPAGVRGGRIAIL